MRVFCNTCSDFHIKKTAFADDTNLLYNDKSIKTLKIVNIDLKSLVNWLNVNKI